MPDVKEVYGMDTKQKPPEPGALDRQLTRRRRRSVGRKIGALAVAAAVGVAAVALILANRPGGNGTTTVPAGEPSSSTTAAGAAAPVGTVTFDGSTCSMELTADRIEPGVVRFEVVNATERPAGFDSWEILEGYSFNSFEAVLERGLRRLEAGKRGRFPEVGKEIAYLSYDPILANSSGITSFALSPGKEYAITCIQRVEGQGVFPWGPVGPITVA